MRATSVEVGSMDGWKMVIAINVRARKMHLTLDKFNDGGYNFDWSKIWPRANSQTTFIFNSLDFLCMNFSKALFG